MPQDQDKKYTYFISGGGTGGHIYPAVTVAEELLKENDTKEIFYVGNPKNLEHEIVSNKENIKFLSINVSGMPRKLSLNFLKWVWDLEIATWKALFYIFKYKPDAIFTTGGYVSAPVAFAAILLKQPFMIHDCDTHPGLVSQNVAPFAQCVSVAFEKSNELLNSNNIICNGNPIRNSFSEYTKQEARKILNLQDKLTVLAMGGSQGAMTINNAFIEIAKELTEDLNIQLIIQTGKKNYNKVIKSFDEHFPNHKENTNLLIRPYFDEMAIPLKASDIAVARAGSLSLSEINVCSLASILVPYPHAAADHQRKNAKEMCEKGASLYLEDSDCTGEKLLEKLKSLIANPQKISEMGAIAKSLSNPDSTENIIKQLKSIIK